jgi:hypothetical protein
MPPRHYVIPSRRSPEALELVDREGVRQPRILNIVHLGACPWPLRLRGLATMCMRRRGKDTEAIAQHATQRHSRTCLFMSAQPHRGGRCSPERQVQEEARPAKQARCWDHHAATGSAGGDEKGDAHEVLDGARCFEGICIMATQPCGLTHLGLGLLQRVSSWSAPLGSGSNTLRLLMEPYHEL